MKFYRVAVPASIVFNVKSTDEDAARREALKILSHRDGRGAWAVGGEFDGTEFARAYVNSGLIQSDVVIEDVVED